MNQPDWTRAYFERGYAQRWRLSPPSDDICRDANHLWTLMHVASGSRLIDIGCGHGRHALALATLGADVVGIDNAVALLSRARDLATETHTEIRLIRGDMRRLPIQPECADAAIIMDAFGFFNTDEEHDTVLREAARILTPGGRLALKIVNGGLIIDDFRSTDRQERDGTVVTIDRSLAVAPARMTESVHISGSRGTEKYERRQRLYRVDELRVALERSGFNVEHVFSQADGAPFDPHVSTTMWFMCQRRYH